MVERKFDVVVVGNVGVDTNVYLYGDEIDFGVEANFTENIDCLGQAGGYASRGYAQLGKRTAFIGHVGDDQLDDEYRLDFIAAADFPFFSAANYSDPTPLMERLLAAKPDQIVVSGLGARGCALGTRDGIQLFEPVTLDAPMIDINGAGDALAVGFLSSYVLDGYSLIDSVRRGQLSARYTCTQKGSASALVTREQLERYYRA